MASDPRLERLELEANGLRFAALACGRGPIALCAHGFPETAETFDRTLIHLAGMGYRAVAPWMRGYWPSAVEGVRAFQVVDLADDLVALAERLSPGAPVALIGHDWGALAAYDAVAMRPTLFRALVTVAIPHMLVVRRTLSAAWGLRHFLEFQLRDLTVRRFRARDFAFVDEIYRRWSPEWRFDPEETAPIKEAFRQPGCLEAALSYYWQFARPGAEAKRRHEELLRTPIPVPTTMVLGREDGALRHLSLRERPDLFPRGVETVWLDGAGHFAHRERPNEWCEALGRALGPAGGASAVSS